MTGTGHPATSALPRATQAPRAPQPIRLPRLRRRTLTTLGVVAIVAIIALNVGRQSFLGWSIDQQAAELEAQVAAAEAENAELQRLVQYLQSDAFITAEARRLRNVGYPGEQVLIIPPDSLAPAPATSDGETTAERPLLEQWVELFFGTAARESPDESTP
jgi:cell division protein FtsB